MPGPIRNGGVVTPVTTPSTDRVDTSITPLTPSAPTTPGRPNWTPPAGPGPADLFNVSMGRLTGVATDALRGAGKSPFELVPGRTPDAVGLPQVLTQVGASPQGQAMLKGLIEQLKAQTGVAVPPDVQAAVLANPAAFANLLQVTPGQLSGGIDALNVAYKAGKIQDVAPRAFKLPQKFDLADVASLDLPRPKGELKELAPGIFSGSLASATPDAQVKNNMVMAEVFDRLSTNASKAPADKFSVTYNGQSFDRVDTLLGALKADGYEVEVSFDQRVANFAELKTMVPGSNPPQYLDVPAPLMLKTGMKDAAGKEAVVPAGHSEMIISVKSGPNTQGPKMDSQTRYFQGIDGTGFFPGQLWQESSWCGRVSHARVTGDKALEAVKLAGAFTDLVDQSATKEHLYADGYGITGVCNDSVAVVQQAVLGHADEYPLLMKDASLRPELKRHLADPGADQATYRALRDAIKALPSDVSANPTMKTRAASSLPWKVGQEPFESSVEARRILSAQP